MQLILTANTEEAYIGWADIKKARSEFEIFVSTISSKKGSIVDSEKLLRYMEKIHQRDLLREKLRLKNCMLRGYKKKLEEQIREKKKMRGTVSELCLQELQVRNAQLQKESDEKRQELQQLQLTSRKMAQVLDSYRVNPS
ncbi:cilia- and flagella-associated protein 263 [Porphyrio hochstetteri]